MARTSIKDIALRAGVSNATVSLVLNGKEKEGRIRAEVAERVREVAKEMNYEPNILARSLRMGRSKTIGVIVADISNSFFANLTFHIQEFAEACGYAALIANTNESGEKMGRMINVLKSHQVDGFIIVPTEDGEECIAALKDQGKPVVLLDRFFPTLPVSHVVVNNYHASFEATNVLVKAGCKRVALMTYDNHLPHMLERQRGYEDALRRAGLPHDGFIRKIKYENIEEEVPITIDALLEGREPVDGIFFATSSFSTIGIRRIRERKLRMQEELRIVSFDKSEAFDFLDVPIPYVQQPIRELGKKSVELLMELIEQETDTFTKVELSATLRM